MQSGLVNFPIRVYNVLAAIPSGRVTSFGTIAAMAGAPRAARQVGGILRRLPHDSSLPWHRVVNGQGRISLSGANYQRQKELLLEEGVLFNHDDRIDMKIYGWYG